MLKVDLDIKKTKASLQKMQKQMPFATSVALNELAKQARLDIKKVLPQLIDRPTPYTAKSLQYEPSTKKNLVAYVGFAGAGFGQMPGGKGRVGFPASEYIGRLERGGTRVPASGRRSIVFPGAHAEKTGEKILDRYGNVSRGRGQKLKNLIGKAKGKNKNYFYGTPKGKPSAPAGVWKRMGKDGKDSIVLLFHFGQRAQYSGNQISLKQRVNDSVQRNMQAKFSRAMRRALRTAR